MEGEVFLEWILWRVFTFAVQPLFHPIAPVAGYHVAIHADMTTDWLLCFTLGRLCIEEMHPRTQWGLRETWYKCTNASHKAYDHTKSWYCEVARAQTHTTTLLVKYRINAENKLRSFNLQVVIPCLRPSSKRRASPFLHAKTHDPQISSQISRFV